ncbi:MAG: YfcE family phosphodiesterase [Campylobacterota bacterium]|nr:YfcE family phosphodiesterase [Campylobacterota bacterium]
MKIAILSDSHKKTKLMQDAIDMLKEKNPKYIIHAGDLEIKENLEILKKSKITYISVFGNNDYNLVQHQNDYNIHKEPYYFKMAELTFKLMHIPYYMTPDTNIIISGHTHMFETQYINDTLYINPGEICARNKNLTECALLEIKEKQYKVEYFYKKPEEKQWKKKEYIYEK